MQHLSCASYQMYQTNLTDGSQLSAHPEQKRKIRRKNGSIAEPEKSELLAKLTDNQGKPWSIASIRKVQDIYRELRFAREFASKIKGPDPTPADLGSGTRKRRRKSTQAKATSIATPIKVLDKMLNDALSITSRGAVTPPRSPLSFQISHPPTPDKRINSTKR